MKTLAPLLVILAAACATDTPDPFNGTRPATTVVVENRNWNTATIRLYCSGALRAAIRQISFGETRRRTIHLLPCFRPRVTVRLLASRGIWRSEAIAIGRGDRLHVVVGHTLPHTYYYLR